jgi:hypothetical protein
MADDHWPPRIFLGEDIRLGDTPLTVVAGETLSKWVLGDPAAELRDALNEAGPPLDLIVLRLPPDPDSVLATLRRARAERWLLEVPVMAIGEIDRSDLDFSRLRALGIVGLVDRRSPPEHTRFRINQLIYTGFERRRHHERVPCWIPVQLEAKGGVSEEFAVTLSEGGMGLSSLRCIAPDTDAVLRFRLDSGSAEPLVLEGRVIYVRAVQRQETRYESGLFFRDVAERTQAAIREGLRGLKDAVRRQWIFLPPQPHERSTRSS